MMRKRAAVQATYEYPGPVYIRFGRLAVPIFHDKSTYDFKIGRGETLTEGTDVAILTTDIMTAETLKAAKELKSHSISARVINFCTIKLLDKQPVLKAITECGKIVTCEEHGIIGGLGEGACAVAAETGVLCKIKRIGVNDEFEHSGPAKQLLAWFGFDCTNIVRTVHKLMRDDVIQDKKAPKPA